MRFFKGSSAEEIVRAGDASQYGRPEIDLALFMLESSE